MVSEIANNLADVNSRIARAAEASGRSPGDVKLIAVSKTHPAEAVAEAIRAGASCFGENKVQEALEKVPLVATPAEWHLIGHLQSNKARKAVKIFDVIHTLDSVDLAERLERICREERRETLAVLIQVDLAGETSKSGAPREKVDSIAKFVKSCRHLRLVGLMTVPPFLDDAEEIRPYFAELRAIRDALASLGSFGDSVGELSMGMSHDMEVAIEEGATMVRVGTAIFGERVYPGR